MKAPRSDFLLLMTLAAAVAAPAFAQDASPATGVTSSGPQKAGPIPDFSGIWAHSSFPALSPPVSGPGPVLNRERVRQARDIDGRPLPASARVLVSDARQRVGDYTNPILKPHAAEVVKRHGEIELSGAGSAPNPSNQCWPSGGPFILWNQGVQILQQPDKITILYVYDHEVRHVALNQAHPPQLTPSWYGHSVGHYEGDTLVIDTVGFKTGPFAMLDQFGTPHTQALHVVERYRLIDYEAAREALERTAKENANFPRNDSGVDTDLNARGKHLQLQLTVEDDGVFTTPWSAMVTYRPAVDKWPELVCAENPQELSRRVAVPTAAAPDF